MICAAKARLKYWTILCKPIRLEMLKIAMAASRKSSFKGLYTASTVNSHGMFRWVPGKIIALIH